MISKVVDANDEGDIREVVSVVTVWEWESRRGRQAAEGDVQVQMRLYQDATQVMWSFIGRKTKEDVLDWRILMESLDGSEMVNWRVNVDVW